jgi:acetate kinase
MPRSILVLNAGSSTVKWAIDADGRRVAGGTVETHGDAVEAVHSIVNDRAVAIDAVGHRIVHGGNEFTAPVRLSSYVLDRLESLVSWAPLHLPVELAAIRAIADRHPALSQVACFDTAFHATMPEAERRFGIPRRFHDRGLRRYGFHGLSYESIAGQLSTVSVRAAAGRTVVCHLGNGASLCGLLAGKSRTTTMGFTPLDGLLMATRPGRLDCGIVLHWLKSGMTLEAVESILLRESGLLGVSGISADMRHLLASTEPAAQEAVDLFCRSVAREVAAAATVLAGLDAIVFTAGIGEHAATVRQRVCEQLAWLGVRIDDGLNERSEARLHAVDSAVEIFRLHTDEESVIARHTANLLGVET